MAEKGLQSISRNLEDIMKKQLIVALLLCVPLVGATDETTDTDAVLQLVTDFFDAMTARDVERMRAMMTVDGIIYGYQETDEGLQIIRPTHREYLENLAIGEGRLVERFWDPRVMVEERLATVWTPYDFYVDGEFNHCGINNFSMLNTDTGWIITGVVFSIEIESCGESPLGPPAN